ncbi:acyl-CoA thioesterase [Pseudonocardia humida]|uniref:Acyl-CoA thioesterase n=1 Tax=Pseudonocardia humida TaxID=2800819 RepID=A0ABT1A8A8_9PSEU|nr:acyl-CoA thioesterase [Pseudonocardia humida]MCO1659166.1 acyl-CoA thioesterase [Pseudonocardia humida]
MAEPRGSTPIGTVFEHPFTVRYFEVDAQGVVFNGWYLGYFDEAMSHFLVARGLPYQVMLDAGYDVQLVRSEIDWKAGLRWQDRVAVAVSTARIGRTSFALDFEVRRRPAEDDPAADGAAHEVTCTGRTFYVVVATDGSGKREIPDLIAAALGAPAPLLPA